MILAGEPVGGVQRIGTLGIECSGGLLIITHSTRILESLPVDYTHILVDGRMVKTGDASLVEEINENGFGGVRAE